MRTAATGPFSVEMLQALTPHKDGASVGGGGAECCCWGCGLGWGRLQLRALPRALGGSSVWRRLKRCQRHARRVNHERSMENGRLTAEARARCNLWLCKPVPTAC